MMTPRYGISPIVRRITPESSPPGFMKSRKGEVRMPIGVICDTAAVAVGGILGMFLGGKLSDGLRSQINKVFGLCSMGIGVSSVVLMKNLPPVVMALIRDQVFQALRKLTPAKLEGRDKGDLISVITSDIELLEVFYAHTISPAAIAALFTIIMCLFMGSFHPMLGILALIAYAVVGIAVPMAVSRLSGDTGLQFRRKSGELSGFALDSMRGLNETLQYGQGEARLAEMNQLTRELSGVEQQMKRTAGRNTAVTNTFILAFDLVMLFVSAALYQNGQVDFAAGNRVLGILEESPVTEEITGKGEVSFSGASAKDVSFAYDNKMILNHVSVDFPEHKIIGIQGRSGSGKSILLKLLMGFWAVREGSIQVSGRSVNEINTENLRDMESYVTQETHLFHDSIRNNLRIAKLTATDEEIENACRKASVHDFIMSLPDGYGTPVGELGETLSGGERQRLGLARAFLHDVPLLLLDEPTSNLDSLNEAGILRSLKEEQQGKTVVLVSHRESTMRIADRVYSVENGRMS